MRSQVIPCALAALFAATAASAQQPAATPTPSAAPATPAAAPAATPASGQAASAERLFREWDKDGNRQLTLEEFRTGWDQAREAELLMRLGQQFKAADSNRSGMLEAAEYARLPAVARAGGGAPPFATFDANKDQKLDFKEYLALVQAMMKRNSGAR